MEWNVIKYNPNFKEFQSYNVLNEHIEKEIKSKYETLVTGENFEEAIKSILAYYYRYRAEYEIILVDWPCSEVDEKIDIYNQVMINWDRFFEYVCDELKTSFLVK